MIVRLLSESNNSIIGNVMKKSDYPHLFDERIIKNLNKIK